MVMDFIFSAQSLSRKPKQFKANFALLNQHEMSLNLQYLHYNSTKMPTKEIYVLKWKRNPDETLS